MIYNSKNNRFISNVSLEDIENNLYPKDNNSILISITDINCNAKIKNVDEWIKIYRFQFEDVEFEEVKDLYEQHNYDETKVANWARIISDNQAKEIANILLNNKKHNIVVHCTAGVSRSGAVSEVGLKIGYKLHHQSNLRTVNKTVLKKILFYVPKTKLYFYNIINKLKF